MITINAVPAAEPLRGFLIDSARCLENREYYRRLIDFCSQRGLNTLIWHFTDDQGCTLQFDTVPEAAGPNAYSKAEMTALVRYAQERGIDLIPELESLGHSRYITNHPRYRHLLETEEEFTAICPVAEETRALMRGLLGEIAEIFDSPYVHVGLDEVKLGKHPLTRQALEDQTEREIFADYVRFLHGEVTQLGRRMIIWGDHRTRSMDLLPLLPRDIVIADWEYTKAVAPAQIQYFLDQGFDVLLCPALTTYDQPFLAGEQLGVSNVRSMSGHQALASSDGGRILGIVTTVWTPTRYLHDAQWLALFLGSLAMADSRFDLHEGIAAFLDVHYGVSAAPTALIEALATVDRLAPLRPEYLALLRYEKIDDLNAVELREKLQSWRNVSSALDRSRSLIRQNGPAFDTFHFCVQFLVHLLERALSSKGDRAILETGRQILQKLEAFWDDERFADDVRKTTTAFAFDRKEHLLLSFADSLKSYGENPVQSSTRRACV